MIGKFRVIETGAGGAVRNMAIDWALLQLRGEGRIPDTLRFYTWKKRTVSVGYSQNLSRELDMDRCREHGVGIVFRPTGGALVLHHLDLTYSIVVGMRGLDPAGWAAFSKRIGCALCKGMRSLGLDSTCEERGEPLGRRNRGPCFLSLSRYEITVGGKKIVGNARRWKRGALLQHGLISLRRSNLSIVDLMAGSSIEERNRRKTELMNRSTTVEEELGKPVSYEDVWPLILDGFRKEFNRDPVMGTLNGFELSRAKACVDHVLEGPVPRRKSGRLRSAELIRG